MRKILYLLLLFIGFSVSAQENKISIELNNADIETAIQTIEKSSTYKFFYIQDWINGDKNTITKSYKDASISDILNDLLKDTDLNFYTDKNKIILTKNNIIRDQISDNYFQTTTTSQPNSTNVVAEKPIFYIQNDTITTNRISIIGKEKKSNSKNTCTLSGYLFDSKTKQPLIDVNISVKGKKINTITDKDGFYSVTLPIGVNYIEAQSVGHNKIVKKVVAYSDGTLNLKLEEKISVIDEVVVNAKKTMNVKSAVTGVTTINIEGIKNIPLVLGERDIFKVATILPGIKQTGEGSAGYSVRGGKEDQNLILLDNGLIYNPSHFFGFFSAVNPITTSKASIYKGSIPPEFGGRLSSVFDITSKNGDREKFSGEGGIGPISSNLALSTPIVKGKSSLLVGGRATYSDWVLKSIKDTKLNKSKASFYDAIIKYNHELNANNTIESTFYLSNDNFSISSDSMYQYSNRLISLKWNHSFSKKLKTDLIYTNSEYKFKIDYESYIKANNFDFGYKIKEDQAILKFMYALNKKHNLNYGISSKLNTINPGYLDPKSNESTIVPVEIDKEKGIESAIYLSDNYKVSDNFQLNFGFRYSRFSALGPATQRIYQSNSPINDGTVVETKSYGNNEVIKSYGGLEPRISGRYIIGDNLSIKGSYDKTYQYIHLLSSNTTQSPTDTWKLSDLNVKPQVAQQFSLGLYKNLPSKDVEISLEGYYKKSENFLDYKVGAQLLLNENIETQLLQGIGKAYGVEFLIKKNSGRLNGWVGYTYSRTFVKLDSQFSEEKVNNGNYFPSNSDKPHDLSIVMNYRFTKRYSMSSNFIYQTGRPITYPTGKYSYGGNEYVLYSDRNEFRIPDYYRLDIGFNFEGTHKLKKLAHGFWNFSIYNVLGRNNPYSIYFVSENGKIKAYKTSIFSIPIPTITYNFKF